MDNIYFIHDAGTGKLIIREIDDSRADIDIEELVQAEADAERMHWGDCSWGGVDSLDIEHGILGRDCIYDHDHTKGGCEWHN